MTAITVSSIDMAVYFAGHGWDDITIAFPANVRQMDALNMLAERISLNLLVESVETVGLLKAGLRFPARIWLKVDVGYRRTGISWNDDLALAKVAAAVVTGDDNLLRLAGLLTHAGHTYGAGSPAKIVTIFNPGL